MTDDATPTPHRLTLMTVHAHPDDETIGTGGTMAKTVADGNRLILVAASLKNQGADSQEVGNIRDAGRSLSGLLVVEAGS